MPARCNLVIAAFAAICLVADPSQTVAQENLEGDFYVAEDNCRSVPSDFVASVLKHVRENIYLTEENTYFTTYRSMVGNCFTNQIVDEFVNFCYKIITENILFLEDKGGDSAESQRCELFVFRDKKPEKLVAITILPSKPIGLSMEGCLGDIETTMQNFRGYD